MSQYAKVNSVVMLKELRSALAKFAETTATALDEVSSEIQRTLSWLNEDRRRYWKTQVRLRQERYVQAKLALKRKGMFDLALAGVRSSALDEKKALALAERQLRAAEQRLARTRSWTLRIEKELSDYRAASQGLSGAMEVDIPNARARLEKMVEALEAYVALTPPELIRGIDEKTPDGVPQSEGTPSTVFRSLATPSDSKQRIRRLRKLAPSLEVRRETPLGSAPADWITAIKFSEALGRAVAESTAEPIEIQPDDKILLAQPQDEPEIVYLQRTDREEGDSGWTIGVASGTESTEYTAMRAAEVLEQCPQLKVVLSLPTGYVVLLDGQEGTEAVYDSQDDLLWPHAEGDGTALEQ